MHLVGAPCDLYMQLLARSSSQSLVALACCFAAILCLVFPIPPSLVRMGLVSRGSVSISLKCFSVTVPGGGPLAGLSWIPPPHVRAVPGSTNFVGTNAQAHLLVMSLNWGVSTNILQFSKLCALRKDFKDNKHNV